MSFARTCTISSFMNIKPTGCINADMLPVAFTAATAFACNRRNPTGKYNIVRLILFLHCSKYENYLVIYLFYGHYLLIGHPDRSIKSNVYGNSVFELKRYRTLQGILNNITVITVFQFLKRYIQKLHLANSD